MLPARIPIRQHFRHPRNWRENSYVYPVISRRSGGLSIGVNLNPDTACNFDCVYCQVDRTGTPRIRDVNPEVVRAELADMIALAQSEALFDDPGFRDVPPAQRRICDFAFSGDGEPTTCRHFSHCVGIVADLMRKAGLHDTKIVLITDACYLTKPEVIAGLAVMDQNNGEIWAKLDAGTEEYFREVNRPNFPLRHVIDQIITTARTRPVVIQALFMRLHGQPPPEAETQAFCDRLNEIQTAGGRIQYVQIYTVARPPAHSFVSALTRSEVDQMVSTVRAKTMLRAEPYY